MTVNSASDNGSKPLVPIKMTLSILCRLINKLLCFDEAEEGIKRVVCEWRLRMKLAEGENIILEVVSLGHGAILSADNIKYYQSSVVGQSISLMTSEVLVYSIL